MRLPPELYDHIIDQFALDSKKIEILLLRFVCRGWIPRVNCHAFRRLQVQLDQPTLSFIREHQIGHYVKELSIYRDSDDYSRASASLGRALEKDLDGFYETLVNVDTLSVAMGDLGHRMRMPWLRIVKNIRLKVTMFRISRVFDLLGDAPHVTTITCTHYGRSNRSTAMDRIGLYRFHFDGQKHWNTSSTSPKDKSSAAQIGTIANLPNSEDSWSKLTHCSIQFEVGNSSFDAGPDLPDNVSTPSLRSLRFVNVLPRHGQMIRSWIRSSVHSLRYLEFSFYRAFKRDDPFALLSFPDVINLEHICILMHRRNYLEQSVVTLLANLPTLGSIKVSLQGFYFSPDFGTVDQLDQILAANPAIQNAEIIGDTLIDISSMLPILTSKNILHHSHSYIDPHYYASI